MSIEKKQNTTIYKKSVYNNRNIFTGINERLFKLIFYTNKEKICKICKNLINSYEIFNIILKRYI